MSAALQRLKDDIARTDEFIAESCGAEGERLVAAIAATGCELDLVPLHAPFDFYYDSIRNVMHGHPDLPLHLRFNMRVHEGVHAIQSPEAPMMEQAIRNMTTGAKDGAILSPDAATMSRSLAEVAAHSIQAKFNVMAANATGNPLFVRLVEGGRCDAYIDLVDNMRLSGCDPEDIRQEVAAQFLDLPVRSMIPFAGITTWRGEFESMTMMIFFEMLKRPDNGLERSRFIEIPENERLALLNAFSPLPNAGQILDRYETGYVPSQMNRDLRAELQAKLG